MLLSALLVVPNAFLQPGLIREHAPLARTAIIPVIRGRVSMMSMANGDETTSGVGFGAKSSYDDAEERGRKALEALKAASADKGYDSSLQGLQGSEETEVEVPQEFKSTVTLGLAGFLIVAGGISLIVGGNLWEPKGFNEDGAPPPESAPAFGFVPTAREKAQVNEAGQ